MIAECAALAQAQLDKMRSPQTPSFVELSHLIPATHFMESCVPAILWNAMMLWSLSTTHRRRMAATLIGTILNSAHTAPAQAERTVWSTTRYPIDGARFCPCVRCAVLLELCLSCDIRRGMARLKQRSPPRMQLGRDAVEPWLGNCWLLSVGCINAISRHPSYPS